MRFTGLDATLYFVTSVWSFLVLFLMLRMRFGVRLRDWAERTSRFRVVQALIVMSLSLWWFELTQLPFDIHRHYVGLSYGLSVAALGIVVRRLGKSLLLGLVFVTLLGWILYGALRRSPRGWWFYSGWLLIPIVILVLFVTPIWIEPMFKQVRAAQRSS